MSRHKIERRQPETVEQAIIQIYDVLVDMEKDLADLSDLKPRVARLERWQSWVSGGSAVLGMLIGYALKSLPDILKGIGH